MMKILGGIYQKDKDSGKILIEGQEVEISTVDDAKKYGISIIHQEICLAENMSVYDNIFMGREVDKKVKGFLNDKEMIRQAQKIVDEMKVDIDVRKKVGELSIAKQQMIEICRALLSNAKVIVMDEPTSSLTQTEIDQLFEQIHKLKEAGIAIVYISHRMEEIYRIGDRVTVLKDGGYVGTWDLSSIDTQQLIVKMVGRELHDVYPDKNRPIGKELLRVENLTTEKIDGVSFTLHEGEVVGLAGLVGSGRTEVLRAIFAADKLYRGKVVLEGNELSLSSSIDAIRHGIGLLPEERKRQGIVNCLSVKDNITMLYSQLHAKCGFLRKADDDAIVRHYIDELHIKTPSAMQAVGNLSGGNQQKVVVSKWLSISPRILLLDEPTQGIDVGAKADIYQLIDRLAREGMGVIVVSSDLIEIINLSNRIVVMRDGQAIKTLESDELTEENVMLYAMGVNADEKA